MHELSDTPKGLWNRKLTFTMTLPRRPADLAAQFNVAEDRRIYNTLVMLENVFKEYLDTRQIILTTHSPTLTDTLEDESLFMLNTGITTTTSPCAIR